MNRVFLGLAVALAPVLATTLPTAASAHHSAAAFDFSKPQVATAVVKSFEVINPHSHLVVTMTDKSGTHEVSFEGHSASNFYRAGYTRGSVNVGDKISITYAPRRDGQPGGFLTGFTTKAGKRVGFGPA